MMAMSPPYWTESTRVQCGVMQSQKYVCTKICTNHFSPAPTGHSFHHILLKCKNKYRQFLKSSSCMAVFSKICMLVRFVLMPEVYIKIIWTTNTSYVSGAFERAASSADRPHDFQVPQSLMINSNNKELTIRKNSIEAQLHPNICTR